MKRKATVSKKRRATTYIPQRGKGWVAISSTDSDISLDFDFTGINSNINSEEQIDELDKDMYVFCPNTWRYLRSFFALKICKI